VAEISVIWQHQREELRIGPFSYSPMRSVDIWLEQTDEFILQSLNPCPEVVQDKEAFVRQVHTHIRAGLRIRIRTGSGFNRVSGSGSVFGIRIRIQEGKNDPRKLKNLESSHFEVLDVHY
jgi:hypothetical protein